VNYRSAVFILAFIFLNLFSFAQEIRVEAQNMPLNKVLLDLSSKYDIQLSFDDQLLSEYSLTLNKVFTDPAEALQALVKPFPLILENVGGVFIIYASPPPKPQKKVFRISGQVLEMGSNEMLPYSHVIINGHATATDLKGSFSWVSNADSIFSVQASQLGYYILDTLLTSGKHHDLYLQPSVIGLKEVVITGKMLEESTQIGNQPGVEKLNHKTAYFLPGFGDNSVYNLLRLQPGILASGEQTSEPTIWGGYAGHSKVMFDGFTIYGLKNFNDNISVFNPLVTKSIDVYKGGYDARYGERVGGIVDVSGKNGNNIRPAFEFCVNNMTMNGILEVPVVKNKSSLLISFRQTYYDLYNPREFNLSGKNQQAENNQEILNLNVIPDYAFRDINIKYAARIKGKDLFYISLYGAKDDFSYAISEPLQFVNLIKNTGEKIKQGGGSIFYGKSWLNGNTSNLIISLSEMKSEFSNIQGFEIRYNSKKNIRQDLLSENRVGELNIKIDNRFAATQGQMFEFGGGIIHNSTSIIEDTFNIQSVNIQEKASRTYLYFQDIISNNHGSNIKLGLRTSYANNTKKIYLEPRISTSIKIAEYWKINAAWGIYNQHLVKASVVDEYGNYRYIWAVDNDNGVPIAHAIHYVLGSSYQKMGFTLSLEGFYKNTEGISRYINSQKFNIEDVFKGKSRSYGLDFMIQKEFRGHQAWVAYTLSKVEEHFDYQINNDYRRAPQDQRHEIKLAALANFDPFFVSSSYVFGSGFPAGALTYTGVEDDTPYSRLDISFTYKFLDRKVKGEVGISILNVLNTQNLKYENFERIPSIQTSSINIYTEAIPFTPALYIKISM